MRRTSVLRILATGVVAAATGAALMAAPAWADDTAKAPATDPAGVAPAMTQGLDKAPREGTPAQAARAHLKAHEARTRSRCPIWPR
ncbi:hypothetical protein [Streptomyces sp. NPDC050507]|uniref:hypothetical protein n=1 Tax=Streptomyces sp. NPDC050507 TaxID=3365619 RepID=UPI0037A66755